MMSEFCFWNQRFFHGIFSNLFSSTPPSTFTRNKTFCEQRGLFRVFGTMRLTGDLHQKIYINLQRHRKFDKIFTKVSFWILLEAWAVPDFQQVKLMFCRIYSAILLLSLALNYLPPIRVQITLMW